MARVCRQAEAKHLGLPGRTALELVSGEKGARAVTLRLVEIPVPSPGETPRGPHHHSNFEECIYVLSGQGTTHADSGTYELRAGDALLVPPGEKHVTRNTGNEPLLLLCFFPVADISGGTREPGFDPRRSRGHRMDVVCLRPEADFARVGALPPPSLAVVYRLPDSCDLGKIVRQARALVIPAVGPRIAPALFEGTKLELVQVTGAGLDRLDEATMKGLGIPVANVPAASSKAVAEYVIAAAVVLLRRLCWSDSEIRNGNYNQSRESLVAGNFRGLEGLLAGVVGLGTIGLAVATAFHKMGCRVCYYDPAPRDRAGAEAVEARPVSLHELLGTADVVSLHVPLLPETRGMIGERQLAKMKLGAVLIQASRGGVVDEMALASHLRAGHLGGAAVDVYSSEPPAANNPLLALAAEGCDRLWLTPHIAGVTRQASEVLFRTAWANVERVLVAGQPPLNRVY